MERKKQKDDDRRAKEAVKAQLEADKKERMREAEERKRRAAGVASVPKPVTPPVVQVSNKNYTEARIQVYGFDAHL
jgi:ribosomal protein L13E